MSDDFDPRKYSKKEHQEWLFKKAMQARTPSLARNTLLGLSLRGRASPLIGRMFFFRYDPKGKNYLPKYDTYPLVIVLQHYPNGFFGINLHYLGIPERVSIMQELLDHSNTEKLTKRTKLLINYDVVSTSAAIAPLAEPCYKRYLFSHVRSRFIEIYAPEYMQALQAPLQQFHFNA